MDRYIRYGAAAFEGDAQLSVLFVSYKSPRRGIVQHNTVLAPAGYKDFTRHLHIIECNLSFGNAFGEIEIAVYHGILKLHACRTNDNVLGILRRVAAALKQHLSGQLADHPQCLCPCYRPCSLEASVLIPAEESFAEQSKHGFFAPSRQLFCIFRRCGSGR
ncbi:hypothetical protein D3C73_1113870 [compost metagenome]